jgi:hypothetical protein
MNFNYQIVIIGKAHRHEAAMLKSFYHRISELGIARKFIKVIRKRNFKAAYKANLPTYCLYFGGNKKDVTDLAFINALVSDSTLILPIAANLKKFRSQIPKALWGINGFELKTKASIDSLVSTILEGLGLLRIARRLFISYKRDESSTVAIQLFEQLEKYGFDVFLDTHSIRPGEPFQDELWQRMADTDVVVLLNTPHFLDSDWTTQELAKANSMSIGIFQLIWPSHRVERKAELSIVHQLYNKDFGNNTYRGWKGYLSERTISKVVSNVESLRARSLASRQNNIINEFLSTSRKLGKNAVLHPQKYITIKNTLGKEVILIPTVGVPQAFTYHQSEDLIKTIKRKKVKDIFLLFDHRNIRDKWLRHLEWLDLHLPVQTIKIVEAEKWLKKI